MIKIFCSWLKEYWSSILILLTIVGFASKALYNYPMGVMALIGLYRFTISPKKIWDDQAQKNFIIVFLCLWMPLLVSFPDAVNQSRAAQTLFPYLRFLFAGLFIIQELSKDKKRLNFIVYAVFIIVAFWCIDAAIQFFIGHDLFGYPYYKHNSVTGVFHPRNTISHICSILSVFCFVVVYQNTDKDKWLWLTLIPIFFVIFVSGRRAAWVMLALSSLGFVIYLYFYSANRKMILKTIGVIALVISIALVSTVTLHKPTHDRFQETLGLFSKDYNSINTATAIRLPIWETAYATFKANPINGIGPRGFRYVYQDYASKDSYFLSQTHPHLLTLEIMTETGMIGVLAYLTLFFLLIKDMLRSKNLRNNFPFLLPVLVALFPFNAHMAFYGSIWSTMIWWLMAVYFSSIRLYELKK